MGKLTTHVLDTANGRPAAGVAVSLFRCEPERRLVSRAITNADGRCDAPLAEGVALTAGIYELEFGVADYFRAAGNPQADPPFLGEVVLRFGVANPQQHYHVPLVVTPWSYSTYRGS